MPDQSSVDQLAGVLLGGIIGIAGSLLAAIVPEALRRRHDRKALAAAIIAEVETILALVEKRGYVTGLREVLERAEEELDPFVSHWFEFSVRHDPFAVYHANLSSIGTLRSPRPELVVRFYAGANAVLEDIADFREGKLRDVGRDEAHRRLSDLYELAVEVTKLGKQILGSSK